MRMIHYKDEVDDNYDGDIDEKGDKNKKRRMMWRRTRNRVRRGIEIIFKYLLIDQPTARNKKIFAEVFGPFALLSFTLSFPPLPSH